MKENAQRTKNGARDATKPMADVTEAALKNYQHALRTGLKLQEEAGKWWNSAWNQGSLAEDWQKRVNCATGVANNFMPLAQKRMEEVMTLMEKNTEAGAQLFKKAVDAAQTPALAESQAKWMDFWTSSMGAVRCNAEAVAHISSKAIDSWIEFVRKTGEVVETQAKAA
jgi:hypothetical protein